MRLRWDIFCTVIDNYGDIGVCWRLARQLVREHRQRVRLWVDDLKSFSRISPDINPTVSYQQAQDVEICLWQAEFAVVDPADVVIEAFACELPDSYVQALSLKKTPSAWINLEYLSAESWVPQYHGLPSPHPRFALTKTFFFPGFAQGTGGLLREKDLMAERNAFDAQAERAFLRRHHLPERKPGEIRILLFCYDTAPIQKLIQVLSESPVPVLLLVPQGRVAESVAAFLNPVSSRSEKILRHQQLTVRVLPWVEQNEFDRLLWSCDINFVRGEDSFVRAQWAVKPFIWNIYPQAEGAHWKKLDAFLDRYTARMPMEMAVTVRALWTCWNGRHELNNAVWMNFFASREPLMQHNGHWVGQLLEQNDLASNLVQFTENRL